MDTLIEWFEGLVLWQQLGVSLGGALVAYVILTRVLTLITRATKTRADDEVLRAIRLPVVGTLVLVAIGVSIKAYIADLPPDLDADGTALPKIPPKWPLQLMLTIGILLWMRGLIKASNAILDALARRMDDYRWIEPRSLPLWEIVVKLMIVGGAILGVILVWKVDPTPWLGAAGIMGIAIGFAAKDTLANLFAGIFILSDAPYKLGDFIITEAGERGLVTDIGMRSTRILTRDDIEITIPNAVMANSKIVNESSGRHVKRRIRCKVGVAYGTDIAKCEEVLIAAAGEVDLILDQPTPRVRFRSFGESSLEFELLGWIDEPVLRGRALHQLNSAVYNGLAGAGITIPFPQRELHIMTPGPLAQAPE